MPVQMTKKRILSLVPLLLVSAFLLYCWCLLLLEQIIPVWRHYVGLALFLPVVYGHAKKRPWAVVGLGIYLMLATFNALAFTTVITTHWLNIGSGGLHTPPVQLSSLGILILWFVLNVDTLIALELDYRAARKNRTGG